jgi:hypothetical protein
MEQTETTHGADAPVKLDTLVEVMIIGNLLVDKIDEAQFNGTLIQRPKFLANQLVESLTKSQIKHLYAAMYGDVEKAEFYNEFCRLLAEVVDEVSKFNFAQYPALIAVLRDIRERMEEKQQETENPA